jgi:hypothetical protein
MMKVVHNSDSIKAITFGDLAIGDVYLDADNTVCIKASSNTCIYLYECIEWRTTIEGDDTEVFPVEADLVIK